MDPHNNTEEEEVVKQFIDTAHRADDETVEELMNIANEADHKTVDELTKILESFDTDNKTVEELTKNLEPSEEQLFESAISTYARESSFYNLNLPTEVNNYINTNKKNLSGTDAISVITFLSNQNEASMGDTYEQLKKWLLSKYNASYEPFAKRQRHSRPR